MLRHLRPDLFHEYAQKLLNVVLNGYNAVSDRKIPEVSECLEKASKHINNARNAPTEEEMVVHLRKALKNINKCNVILKIPELKDPMLDFEELENRVMHPHIEMRCLKPMEVSYNWDALNCEQKKE